MTSQRKVNSSIQHRFGEQLFCSQSFEVSFYRITYSKTAAQTQRRTDDSTATLDLSFPLFLLIPERCCCVTVTSFYCQEITASPPVHDSPCPWQQSPTPSTGVLASGHQLPVHIAQESPGAWDRSQEGV